MRNLKLLLTSATLTLVLLSGSARANTTNPDDVRTIGVAVDPVAWALRGFSGILTVVPRGMERYRISLEVFGLNFPSALIELNEENKGEGWAQRINVAGVLYFDRHFGAQRDSGFHAGGVVNVMFSKLTRDGMAGDSRMATLELMARGGYRWFPIDGAGLFINPWLAIGPAIPLKEPEPLGDEVFAHTPIQLLSTVHLGWRFDVPQR